MVSILRVDKVWQLAQVYEIRRRTEIDGKQVTLQLEFDEKYGKKYNYLLALEKGIPVGTVRINLDNQNYGKIERVSIVKEYQYLGYGKKLIVAAEKWIIEEKRKHIVITSLPSAEGFYEKQGYFRTKIVDLSGHKLIFMEKSIGGPANDKTNS